MKIKSVVKVMNFHALLRVDAARRKAEKYMLLEQEVSEMINIIAHNRNFQLDRRIAAPSAKAPALNLYIGSDYGFCGSVNYSVSHNIQQDSGIKITIGKKLHSREDVLLRYTREDFEQNESLIRPFLVDAVSELKYSQINIIYNEYKNSSEIHLVRRKIFPLDTQKPVDENCRGDFILEGDPAALLEKLMISYLDYEVKIAFVNSYASENVTRQNTTAQSLKKIEEREEDEQMAVRKKRNKAAFDKVIDTYTKKVSLGGGESCE